MKISPIVELPEKSPVFHKKSSFLAFKNGPIHLWKYFDLDEEHQGQRNILLVFGKFSKTLGLNFLGFSTFFRIFDISPRLNTQNSLYTFI